MLFQLAMVTDGFGVCARRCNIRSNSPKTIEFRKVWNVGQVAHFYGAPWGLSLFKQRRVFVVLLRMWAHTICCEAVRGKAGKYAYGGIQHSDWQNLFLTCTKHAGTN
jgi:hypothetical protein